MSPHPNQAERPRGYTLPVWVAAAARAALAQLRGEPFSEEQLLRLDPSDPAAEALVPVVAAAPLGEGRALAVARCDPGDGLDLTRGLVVWVEASWRGLDPSAPAQWLWLEAGEGVGVHADSRALCISAFARELLERSLAPLLPAGRGLRLRLTFPAGRRLAERTSNAAFGVVEGLALIGTQAETQASAAPDQLRHTLESLARRTSAADCRGDLVLVIGENGLDLAPRLGLPASLLLKTGNWIGPVLVAAAQQGVRRLLLFGYQGKLLKLAGGIFHTHHHLADGRAEVLTAFAALEGLQGTALAELHGAATVEAAFQQLRDRDPELAARLGRRLAAALFDRQRQVCASGPVGALLFSQLAKAP
jgi:cobalt-precorrin-5B (C1)-methyltransferase